MIGSEWVFSLEGCQIVAGGRSAAQTIGKQRAFVRTLKECQNFCLSGSKVISFDLFPAPTARNAEAWGNAPGQRPKAFKR